MEILQLSLTKKRGYRIAGSFDYGRFMADWLTQIALDQEEFCSRITMATHFDPQSFLLEDEVFSPRESYYRQRDMIQRMGMTFIPEEQKYVVPIGSIPLIKRYS